MMGFLLRNDLMRLTAPALWVMGLVYGVIMADSANKDMATGYGPHTVDPAKPFLEWMMVNTVMICGLVLGSMQAFRVATPFQRTLPIDARALFWERMAVTIAGVLGASLLSSAMFLVNYDHALHPLQVTLSVNAQALIVLVPLLFHSMRVDSAKGMPWYLFAPLLVAIVWLGVRLGMRSYWPATLWLGLAAGLALSIKKRLPRGYLLSHGSRSNKVSDALFTLGDRLCKLPGLGPTLTLDRSLRQPLGLNPRHLLIFFSLTLLLGVVAFTRSPWGGLLAVVLLQMAWFSRCVVGAGRVAHLPITRERLFRHAVVPGLGLLAATAVADMAGWWTPSPTWPALLVLWAFTWWQLLSLFATPTRRLSALPLAKLIAAGSYLVVVTGVAFDEGKRTALADWVVSQSPDILYLAAAAAWLGSVLILRRTFLRADSIPLTASS